MFFQGTPIFRLVDRAHRSHGGQPTPDRSEESIRTAPRPWPTYMGKTAELLTDMESAAASDSMVIWLGRRGIRRRLVSKESHLGLVEHHGEILIDALRILLLEAEQEGLRLDLADAVWECFDAKNSTDDHSGYSRMPAHARRNSKWGVETVDPEDAEFGPFVHWFRVRVMAMTAIQPAI